MKHKTYMGAQKLKIRSFGSRITAKIENLLEQCSSLSRAHAHLKRTCRGIGRNIADREELMGRVRARWEQHGWGKYDMDMTGGEITGMINPKALYLANELREEHVIHALLLFQYDKHSVWIAHSSGSALCEEKNKNKTAIINYS